MKKLIAIIFIINIIFNINSTPDKAEWICESLIGINENSYVINQLVFNNMQSHYNYTIENYIIIKDRNTDKILNNVLIRSDKYSEIKYDEKNKKAIWGKDQKQIKNIEEIISDKYDLILPGNHYISEFKMNIQNKELIFKYENNEIKISIEKYLSKEIINDSNARIVMMYEKDNDVFLLIEFGKSYYDSNYYQKIIHLPGKIFADIYRKFFPNK